MDYDTKKRTRFREFFILICIFTGMMFSYSCDSDTTTSSEDPQVADIVISPDQVSFKAGEQQEFSVAALTASGDTIDSADLDIQWQWWSTNPDVFTVEAGGTATGHAPGEAYCIVEATIDVSGLNLSRKAPISYAGFGVNRISNETLTFDSDSREKPWLEKAEFKNKLRFTGRDSAVVMIF